MESVARERELMAMPGVITRHKLLSALTIVIVLPIVAITVWTESALHFTYASGTRAGYLQKISRKGWLCKTWEGEMQLTAIPGSTPEKFVYDAVRFDRQRPQQTQRPTNRGPIRSAQGHPHVVLRRHRVLRDRGSRGHRVTRRGSSASDGASGIGRTRSGFPHRRARAGSSR